MSELDWYNDLFSKVQENKDDIQPKLDLMKVTFKDGDTVLQEWDLTEELQENGMARLEIENETLNVHWIMHIMSHEVKEIIEDEDAFKKLEKLYMASVNTTRLTHTLEREGGDVTYSSISVGLGLVFVVMGSLGLFFKIKEANTQSAAKLVKSSASLWCGLVGLLLTISEVVKYSAGDLGVSVSRMTVLLQKVSVLALKNHTIIVYLFQTAMIYCPFFFREHKENFAKWLVRATISQWVFSFCAPLIWALVFIFIDWEDCTHIIKANMIWQYCYIALLTFGYLGSFILSLVYVVGYYKKSRENVSSSQKINIKQTMVACSVEILYDISAVIYEISFTSMCAANIGHVEMEVVQPYFLNNICDIIVRIEMLVWDHSTKCVFWAMLFQQLVQEAVYLVTAIAAKCRVE